MKKTAGNPDAAKLMPQGPRAPFGIRRASFLRASGFRVRHFLALTACAALAQEAAPPDEEDVPEVEEEWDFTKGRGHDLTLLDKLVPEGQSHTGLRYPVYRESADGKAHVLQSQFESKVATRLDANHLQFKDAVVSTFGDQQHPSIATRIISMGEAYYDLQHDLLFSNAPVLIQDQRGTIQCGAVLHDQVTGLTAFSRGVKLYFNESPPVAAQPAPPPAPPSAGTPDPKAPPQPPPAGK